MATDASMSTDAALQLMGEPVLSPEAVDLRTLADVRDKYEASGDSFAKLIWQHCTQGREVYWDSPFDVTPLEAVGRLTIETLKTPVLAARGAMDLCARRHRYNKAKEWWMAREHEATPAVAALNASSGHRGCLHCLCGEGMSPAGCEREDDWVTLVRDNPDFVPYLCWAFNCPRHSHPEGVSLLENAVTWCAPSATDVPMHRPQPYVYPLFLNRGVLDSAAVQILRLRSSQDKTILPDVMGVVGKLLEPVRALSPSARARMVEVHTRMALLMTTAPGLICMLRRAPPVGNASDGGDDDAEEQNPPANSGSGGGGHSDTPPTPPPPGLGNAGQVVSPPSPSSGGHSGSPAQPQGQTPTSVVAYVDGKLLLTHHHEGIKEGESVKHWHQCEDCKTPFEHKHRKKSYEVSSANYAHVCKECAKKVKTRKPEEPPSSAPQEGDEAEPQEVEGVTYARAVQLLENAPRAAPPEEMPLPCGYISPEGPFPTRDDVTVTKKEKTPAKKEDVKAERKKATTEAIWRLFDSGQHAAALDALNERTADLGGSLREAFHFIGHYTPGLKFHVSSGHHLNFLHALGGRHFKERPAKDPEAMRDLSRVAALVTRHIVSMMLRFDTLDHAATLMEAMPSAFKSKKWAPERFRKELIAAALAFSCERPGAKTGLPRPRSITVKLNEALAKIKPRLIMASGDRGAVTHLFDAAIIEHALFHLQAFEERSIKHAGLDGKCARMRKMMARYKYVASMDFGAFDGSIDAEVRDSIENRLVRELAQFYLPFSPLKEAAVIDRNKEEFNGYFEDYNVRTRNMIRESGDRGTSVLNYVTNFTLFVYGLWREKVHQLMCQIDGGPAATANKGDAKNQADKYVLRWLAESESREADIVGEGDDGSQFFSEAFVERAAAATSTGPVFGERWVGYYREVGFSLEPQGPVGEVAAKYAIRKCSERAEFISTVWVSYLDGALLPRTYAIPKPVKTVTGSLISFAVGTEKATAAYTKMVSLMDNCIHCPVLFEFFHMQARYWAHSGGVFDANALTAFKREHLSDRRLDEVRDAHQKFLLEDGAADACRKAFQRETGIDTDAQVALEAAYRATSGLDAAVSEHSRRLYGLLGMVGDPDQ